MRRLLLLLLTTISIINLTQAQNCPSGRYVSEIFTSVQKTEGIQFGSADPYGLINNQNLFLDVFEPVGDTVEKRPLVLHQFGGGFLIGWRTEPVIPQMGESYAKRGFVFATIDYRLGFNPLDGQSAERAVYRASQDLRASLRFLVDNADLYGIDTSQIFLTGTSAGCLAAFVNTFMNESDRVDIPSTYGILLEPQDLGCANCSGNNNFNNQEVPVKGIINNWGAMLDTSYIDLATDPADNVPVISFHGTEDFIVPYVEGSPFSLPIFPDVQGSFLIHERLENQGIKNRLYPLQGLGHEPQLLQLQGWVTDTILQLGSEFLHEIMQPVTSDIFGDSMVCQDDTVVYSVTYHLDNNYCWSVQNGTILDQNLNMITVYWGNLGAGSIEVQEYNEVHAITSKTLDIQIGTAPDPSFTFTSDDGLFQFQNTDVSANAFFWSLGDGNNSFQQNPQHQYMNTGSFSVVFSLSNQYCERTSSATIVSDICPNASFNFTIGDSLVYFQNTTEFEDDVVYQFNPQGNLVYLSDFSLGLVQEEIEVCIIANNQFCSDTVCEIINVQYCPIAEFEVNQDSNQVTFTNNSVNQTINFWDFGEGSTTSNPNPSFTYTETGDYQITLIVFNDLLCSDTVTFDLTIEDPSTSISETSIQPLFQIIPNPASDFISIQGEGLAQDINIVVLNTLGQVVLQSNRNEFSTSLLNKGLYTVMIESNGRTGIEKLIKH